MSLAVTIHSYSLACKGSDAFAVSLTIVLGYSAAALRDLLHLLGMLVFKH
jgi:hypothetical protein